MPGTTRKPALHGNADMCAKGEGVFTDTEFFEMGQQTVLHVELKIWSPQLWPRSGLEITLPATLNLVLSEHLLVAGKKPTYTLKSTINATRARVEPLSSCEEDIFRVEDHRVEDGACHQGGSLRGGQIVSCSPCSHLPAPRPSFERSCSVKQCQYL